MDNILQQIKSRIQEDAGDYLNLPKVILIGNIGAGKTSLLSALGGQSSSGTESFNFSVDPQHRFLLCDFMPIAIKDEQKYDIISNIINYLFETSPDTDSKVTILLVEDEVHVMGTRLRCVIEDIIIAQAIFGKLCQLEARFGIVITKCIDTEFIKEEFYDQLDNLPGSQIDDIKAYFDHIFMMPKIDTDTFEDKERIISFILGKYIEPEETDQYEDDDDDIEEPENSVDTAKEDVICTTCSKSIEADKIFGLV